MKHSKHCQIQDMTDLIIANRKPDDMGIVPPEYLSCDKPAKHSIVYRSPGIQDHKKIVIRMCDYHFYKFKEGRDNREGNALINLPFTKYRENRL